ncbi:MAG: phosphate/phosphite/phosphonate ABC transporter substrate-binding protein [Candidatus Omnitrophota bacterium]|nr:phosphate/phosphite/phosphonate ABC transporter substrate-binding protein [Candidatus Omnitrophota bacterium]
MFKREFNRTLILLIFILSFYASSYAQQKTLTIGRVSDDPQKHYKKTKPFIDYIAKNLKTMGIKEGKVLLAKDNHQLIKYLREGKLDIITETPYSSIIYMEKAGAKPILRRWKKGIPTYHSVIFARKDSNINSLKDLKGKVIAFEDTGSTSGYFLPKTTIIKEGLEMVRLDKYTQKPPADKVGYCFAGGEINISHWVHKGLVDAGVLSNEEYEEPDEVPAGFISDFKVIYETEDVPRNLILVRGDMEPKLQEEIKNILLNMRLSQEGRKAMWNFQGTANFDEFPEGIEVVIRKFKERYDLIKEEIEKEYPE